MKFSVFVLSSALVLILSSCASGVRRGSVVMRTGDDRAHVGMGGKEVSVGDHLVLYKNVCTGVPGSLGAGDRSCQKKEGGHGEVTKILSADYSEVKFPAGTQFAEGDTLEKHSH